MKFCLILPSKKVSQCLNILNLHILPKNNSPWHDKWIFMFLVVLTAFLIRIKLIVGPHNPNVTTLHTVFCTFYGKLKHCCWFNHAAVQISVVFQQIRIPCSLSWPIWVQGWQVALVIFSANVLSRFLAVSQKISADNLLNNLLLNNVKPHLGAK